MRNILFFISLVVVSGCSTNAEKSSILSSFYSAYSVLSKDHTLSKAEAENFQYAVMQVSLDGNQQILMPLGELLGSQQKWYSQDFFSFTTRSGRVVQVYNVNSEISAIRVNPLWQRFDLNKIALNQQIKIPIELDFLTLKRFAVKGVLTIQGVKFEERVLWGEPVSLLRIEEEVFIPSMNYRYVNVYWKDSKRHFIWESIQKWGEDVPEIHYKVVKPWLTVHYP